MRPIFKKLWILILAITVTAFWFQQLIGGDEYYYDDTYYYENSDGIANIKLQGTMLTYISEDLTDIVSSEYIVEIIEEADNDEGVEGIILEIDSTGGYPVAGEEIANALKRANKPTVAVIRQTGTSAAYWAATGADKIFASSVSDIGGIGVTMSYLDYSKQNEDEGITYNSISAGKYKDAGDYDKPLTEEEKMVFQRDVDITYEKFIQAVAENRNLDIEKVRTIADGSSMMGDMALENGLIDEIGGVYEAEEYLLSKNAD